MASEDGTIIDTKTSQEDNISPTIVPSTVETKVSSVTDQFKLLSTVEAAHKEGLRAISEDSYLTSEITFNDPTLEIPKPIRDALILEMKFDRPTRIQRYALPIVLKGGNLIAQAQTSAGKTVAFVIGMLYRCDPNMNCLQAICLTPTRELANQIISDAIIPLSKYMPHLRVEAALKGVPTSEISTAHMVVGTPGTVAQWLQRRYINTSSVKIFVLDEADEMVSNKFLGKATLEIKERLHPSTQILFFSATYTTEILNFSKRLVQRATVITLTGRGGAGAGSPVGGRGGRGGGGRGPGREVQVVEADQVVGAQSLVLDVIKQVWIDTASVPGGKNSVLKDIYAFLTIQQSIVFVGTKASADEVTRVMTQSGFEVSTLHSDLEGPDRDAVMARFRTGQSKVLITTNVLARGVDVPSVAVVVNYDIPTERRGRSLIPDHATYLHRIGRTGRFNRAGTAITFVHGQADYELLRQIENVYAPGREMIQQWAADNLEQLGTDQLQRMDKFTT